MTIRNRYLKLVGKNNKWYCVVLHILPAEIFANRIKGFDWAQITVLVLFLDWWLI